MVGFYTPAKKIDIGVAYLLFVSGVQTETCIGEIEMQTREVFEQISAILKAAGATIDNVVKAVIYVTDMADFEVVSKIREEYFKNCRPVSTFVEVTGFVRDEAVIEIEVTAVLPK